MKKLKFVFLSFIVLFTLSGCLKSTATMTINEDKSMRFQATYLLSKQLASLNDLDKSSFTKKGFNVTDVDSDGYVGFEVSKDYKNIDDLSSETGKEVVISDFTEENFDHSVFFKVKKGFFKNTYTATFKYDFSSKESPVTPNNGTSNPNISDGSNDLEGNNSTDKDNDVNANDDVDYSKLLALSNEMEIKFIVNLPTKNISNNASSVDNDGKRLTWNLTPNLGSVGSSSSDGSGNTTLPDSNTGSTNNIVPINYSFTMLNMGSIYLVSGIGAIILITIIIVVVSKVKKRGNKESNINASEPANEANIEIDPNKTLSQVISDSVNLNLGVNQANSNVQPQVSNPISQVENVNTQQGKEVQTVQPSVQPAQVVNNPANEVVQPVITTASSDNANAVVNQVTPQVGADVVQVPTNESQVISNVSTTNANSVSNEVVNNNVNNTNVQ